MRHHGSTPMKTSEYFSFLGLSLLLLGITSSFTSLRAAEPIQADAKTAKPAASTLLPIERLLPAKTVFLFLDEGFETTQSGWDRTAASDALSKTGLFQMGERLATSYFQMAQSDASTTAEAKQTIEELLTAVRTLSNKGFVVAASLPETDGTKRAAVNWPQLTVVLPHSGAFATTLRKIIALSVVAVPTPTPPVPDAKPEPDTPETELKAPPVVVADPLFWKTERIGSREIQLAARGKSNQAVTGIDMAFWDEGGHFVFVIGTNAIQSTIALSEGKAPDITSNRIWQELHPKTLQFSRRSFGWVDVRTVRAAFDDQPLGSLDFLEENGFEFEAILEGIGELIEAASEVIMMPFEMFSGVEVNRIDAVAAVANDLPMAQLEDVAITENDLHEIAELRAQGVPLSADSPLVAIQDLLVEPESEDLPNTADLTTDESPIQVNDRILKPGIAQFAVLEDPQKTAKPEPTPTDEPITAVDAPEPESSMTVKTLVTVLGLENVQHYTWQSGYKGRALWSESRLTAPGPKRGLLALLDQPSIKLEDLPPLPADIAAFYATSVDVKKLGATYRQLMTNLASMISPTRIEEIEKGFKQWRDESGPLYDNLISAVDPVVCVYNDGTNGPLSIGPVLVWKVKDATRLRRGLNKVVALLTTPATPLAPPPAVKPKVADVGEPEEVPEPEQPNRVQHIVVPVELKVTRKTRMGREVVALQYPMFPMGIAYVVDDQWFAISLNSQLLDAFLLRLDGKLPRWEPTTAHREALSELPERFTSISIEDPRKSLPQMISLGHCALSWIEGMTLDQPEVKKLFAEMGSLPPAELIIQPLFPNVTVTTVDDTGLRSYSRTSLPSLSWSNYAVGYVFLMFGGGNFINF